MTDTAKQLELLNGVYTLGSFTEQYPFFEEFAKRYKEELQLTQFVSEGQAKLTEDGEFLINALWMRLLKDHLVLKDSNFDDMNELVVAVHERGNARGRFIF